MANDELGNIDWLAPCTPRERLGVRKRADIVEVPAGTTLIREGDAPRWFYAVVDGTATLRSGDRVVAVAGPNETLNEVDVLRNEVSTTTVVAETDLTLLVMGRREFLGMLDDTPGVARRLLMPHIPTVRAANTRRPTLVPVPAA